MSLLNENDNKYSIVNLLLFISILVGFLMFGVALYTKQETAFIPLAGVLSTAIGSLGVKAYKGSS